ncbi:M20 aminoacylase family protein [Pseudorhodobacter aquimaris]|uniref:M20 aminoacylase family protein n=1 Tax=Pseudorhodobacter aquimaris TaxID=687412 RepID=UPI00067CC274|nr:M20 aminoacylase family protein [Pseudorhodobacter aquimaris]
MPVKNRFAEMLPELTAIRRDFHENPELLYEVHRTAGKIAQMLRLWGCDEVVEGVGRTGVVGVIHGKTDSAGRVIGLRADMDALPIMEATGLDYASKVPGKMHACGHDGHSTMLLGAARYLCETRNFDGKAVMIFQPAEEGGAGADAMCKDGLMDRWNIQEVYGLHNMPGYPVGDFEIRPGPIMAAADHFEITVTGKGGHAAKPDDCVDALLVASHIIVGLQSIVARNLDPLKQAVVSTCTLSTDSNAHNVIPQTVVMKGTVRTFDAEVQDMVEARVRDLPVQMALAYGARAEVAYQRGYPATVNAADNTGYAAEVAHSVSGRINTATPPMMGAEDFSFMLNERPGAYIFLGNGDSAMIHHPAYDFDDGAIPFGASWYVGMVEARLPL